MSETSIAQFFKGHLKELQKNYPGLTVRRLEKEFQIFQQQFSSDMQTFESFLHAGYPLEYINKCSYFYKSEFYVDERVLIPRSETEILVELAKTSILKSKKSSLNICEVGVGSGAIGLSLLQEITDQTLSYLGTDVSEEALQVFDLNAFRLNYKIPRRHTLLKVKADRLEGIQGPFDVILSNPPYIKENADRSDVHEQVLNYEPNIALFLEDDTYDQWFLDFFQQIKNNLVPGGVFFMEGHENHLERLKNVLNEMGAGKVELHKDFSQRHRFLELNKD